MASEMSLRLYESPLVVTDSGGKDSAVCREIARRAGIPYEVQHNLTTADAPPTIYYVRETFRKLEEQGITCRINYPAYKGQRKYKLHSEAILRLNHTHLIICG